MQNRKRVFLLIIGILVLAVVSGFIADPRRNEVRIGNWSFKVPLRLGLDLQGGTHLVYSANMQDIPSDEHTNALEGVRDVIERRVNSLGVAEPIVQTQVVGDDYRVIADLAGITDISEAIALIGETPTLDFRELQLSEEAGTHEEVQGQHILFSTQPTDGAAVDSDAIRAEARSVLDRAVAGEDFSALANEFTDDPGNQLPDGTNAGGDLGFAPRGSFVTEFDDVLFDKLSDGGVFPELVETQFGFHIIKRVATQEVENTQSNFVRTALSGKQLQRADVIFDQQTGAPAVQLTFNDEGKVLFGEITERNLNQPVGIFLDDAPISTPVVQAVIPDGVATITGTFTLQEAKDLAQRLNAGALPVPVSLITQQNVGASLGTESVQKSIIAGVIGLLAVIIFMILFYRLPGLLSVFALTIYTLVTFAIFKLFSVTLTLAGVAGFIFSIGIAVDANILIFERLKEELRGGQEVSFAIEEGFRRAWTSIRDSNISSLITTLILIWFGTSLIKGFAITLSIGIFVSMFSAITVTRTFMRFVLTSDSRAARWLLGVKDTEKTQ
ncbi:MAG: protein translocase subunit SecD [Patescibacteria group bacterium]